MHGVGFWEEKPIVSQPNQWSEGSFDYVLEPATPHRVLIADDGYENLTRYLFDPVLRGGLSCINVRLQSLGSGTDSCAALHQNTAPGSRAKQKRKLVQVGDPEYM